MDIIQYSAWSIDRSLELAKINGKEVKAEDLVNSAKVFAKFMDEAIEKSGEMEKTIEDEVTRRLEIELMKIKDGDNGLN